MNRCPITYEACGSQKYSKSGLRLLSRNLKQGPDFPYSANEQIELSAAYADKLSIQGIQPKLSVRLNAAKHQFEAVAKGGTYIIKPQHPFYPELPENEDLTMRLADRLAIEVPVHGLIYTGDASMSYFIKRFDRYGHGKKLAVEDFAQLSGHARDTKYDSSMEKLIPVLDAYCSFPALEKLKLFRITLFCFLVGNEDMHLKNFSLIRRPDRIELSPAYDLVNSTLVINGTNELALPLMGKRSNLTRKHLVDYYGHERLGLNWVVINDELNKMGAALGDWMKIIARSFLSEGMQERFGELIQTRWKRIIH